MVDATCIDIPYSVKFIQRNVFRGNFMKRKNFVLYGIIYLFTNLQEHAPLTGGLSL